MGANTKQLRNRIKSVDSTLHLTRAMGLVASSKLRKAMESMNKGRQYESAVKEALEPLMHSAECKASPYMTAKKGGKLCLVVIAGDRGLAGGYNANIFRALREYEDIEIIPIGKRACDRFHDETRRAEGFSTLEAYKLATKLCQDFKEGKYNEVAVLSTKYKSMISQEVALTSVLPLAPTKEATVSNGMVYEPDELTILETAVPEYVAGILVSAVREGFACEIVARRTAMDSAGKNAQEMIDRLQLEYNRARQSAITQEITEIVAGSGQ